MKWILSAATVLLAITQGASAAQSKDDWPGRWYLEARGGLSSASKVYLTDIRQGGLPLAARPPSFGGPDQMGTGWLKYKIGWMVAAAGGYQISDYFRAEVEVSYRDSKFDQFELNNFLIDQPPAPLRVVDLNVPASGDSMLVAGLANGYFDIRQSADQRVVPFIGAGVGAGYLDLNLASPLIGAYETKQAVFVWNAGFGVLWGVTRHVGLSLAYRYIGIADVDVPSIDPTIPSLTMPYGAHEAYLALRYTF